MSEWRGQNQKTLAVGWFPASLTMPTPPTIAVALPPTNSGPGPGPVSAPVPIPVPAASFISTPLKGSLHHAGHGDVHPDRSWGTPESLDESVVLPLCPNMALFYYTFTADNKDRLGLFLGLTCFLFSVQQWELEATGSCQREGRHQFEKNGRWELKMCGKM